MLYTTIHRRIALFSSALVVASVLIGFAAWLGWVNSSHFSHKITQDELESYNIGDEFNANLRSLQLILLRYELRRIPADWDRFQIDRRKLDEWIDQQKKRVHTSDELAVLDKIDTTYDQYYRAATVLHDLVASNHPRLELADPIEDVEKQVQILINFDSQLLAAHSAAMEKSIGDWRSRLHWLQALLFGALILLVLSAVLLGTIVWRDMIQPLRLQLVESQELLTRTEKLAALGVLAAGVAHEIRNPLTAIKARLYTQQKLLPEGSPAAADSKVISNEINRLELIVREVLEFARPADPAMAEVDCAALLAEVADLLRPQIENGGGEIQLECRRDLGLRVLGDAAQLKQVLINIVQNAVDASGRRGRVRLRCQMADHRLAGAAIPVVILEIEDNGPGIPAGIQERLFDPFFTTKETGTGLGLSIAARIVEKHGGVIEFQTDPHRGTTFGVVLPRYFGGSPASSAGVQGTANTFL